jgi:CRP/FNR family cyclic AMP-dependent transcriptional regulator
MPSASHVELDQPSRSQSKGLGADLYSLLREIHTSKVSHLNSLHRRGKVLYAEGEPAEGIYILRTGSASVSISSSEGRVVTLRLARAGDVLGLNSVLHMSSYDTTVKTLEPCRTDFISRVECFQIVERSPSGAHVILKILSRELTELTDRARSLLLPQTAAGKLARLLLEWSSNSNGNESRIDKVFTQEEIAQMICSSRETVTRLLAALSRRQVIEINPDSILIRDREALERVAHG